jgi:hypothetical protein
MSGNVNITGTLSALPQGTLTLTPPPIVSTPSNLAASTNIILASGANTITVPTWASGAIIVQNPANLVAVTLKGITGDTGIGLSLTESTCIAFAAPPPASFVLTAGAPGVQETTIVFF